MSEELSQLQLNHLNAANLFELNRSEILETVYPFYHLVDLRQEIHTEFHCESPYFLKSLCHLLPFVVTLTKGQTDLLFDRTRTSSLIHNAHRQLLYWYLARAYVRPLQQAID